MIKKTPIGISVKLYDSFIKNFLDYFLLKYFGEVQYYKFMLKKIQENWVNE